MFNVFYFILWNTYVILQKYLHYIYHKGLYCTMCSKQNSLELGCHAPWHENRQAGSFQATQSTASVFRLSLFQGKTKLLKQQESCTLSTITAGKLWEVLTISMENLRSSDSCFFTKQKHHILPMLVNPALTQTRAACLFLLQQKTPCTASFFHGQESSVKLFNQAWECSQGARFVFKWQCFWGCAETARVHRKVSTAHVEGQFIA